MTVKQKIQATINAANATTSHTDADLTTAVKTLIAGYGQGGGIGGKEVLFYDYDGTVLYSYSAEEFLSMSSMPSNPVHEGLVAQGWNWSLHEAKEFVEECGKLNIGQMYKTDSGFTEIDIVLTKKTGLNVTCNIVGTKDWGDGTTDINNTHTYSDFGNYVIKCNGTDINQYAFGNENYYAIEIRISGEVTSIGNSSFYNCYSLLSVAIPKDVISISNRAFTECRRLKYITIPNNITNIFDYTFYDCFSLTKIALPNGITSIGDSSFRNCSSLDTIIVPNTVTVFYNSAFRSCYSLKEIIYNGIANINGSYILSECYPLRSRIRVGNDTVVNNYSFYKCYNIICYDFTSSETIPTLDSTNAFSYINGLCKIIVPDELYDDWIVATNWVTYADYIYKASEVTE